PSTSLNINPRTATTTADATSKTYCDADPASTSQTTPRPYTTLFRSSGCLTRDTGENVGPYAIKQGSVALSTNYTLSFTSTNLTINPRAVTIAADAKSKTYGDADPALTYQITIGSLVNGEAFSGSLTR